MNKLELIVNLTEATTVLDAKLYIDEKSGEPRLEGLYRHQDFGDSNIESIYRFDGKEWKEISIHVYKVKK